MIISQCFTVRGVCLQGEREIVQGNVTPGLNWFWFGLKVLSKCLILRGWDKSNQNVFFFLLGLSRALPPFHSLTLAHEQVFSFSYSGCAYSYLLQPEIYIICVLPLIAFNFHSIFVHSLSLVKSSIIQKDFHVCPLQSLIFPLIPLRFFFLWLSPVDTSNDNSGVMFF